MKEKLTTEYILLPYLNETIRVYHVESKIINVFWRNQLFSIKICQKSNAEKIKNSTEEKKLKVN